MIDEMDRTPAARRGAAWSARGTFVRTRHVGTAVSACMGLAVLILVGGEWNIPLPGARVPIVLGTITPLVAVSMIVASADGGLGALESVAARHLGRQRLATLGTLTFLYTAVIVAAGSASLDLARASALGRDVGILLGPASLAWRACGRGAGIATAIGAMTTVVTVGAGQSADGIAAAVWALPLADPDSWLAAAAGVVGAGVAGWAFSARTSRALRL